MKNKAFLEQPFRIISYTDPHKKFQETPERLCNASVLPQQVCLIQSNLLTTLNSQGKVESYFRPVESAVLLNCQLGMRFLYWQSKSLQPNLKILPFYY